MASRPQDYISNQGRTTTNVVEGFHAGLALIYRDKRTDLGSSHYKCKTNMSICHKVIRTYTELGNPCNLQNLGPIWKVLCCADMGVEMPLSALEKILAEQKEWKKQRSQRSGEDFYQKRYHAE